MTKREIALRAKQLLITGLRLEVSLLASIDTLADFILDERRKAG